MQNTAGGNSDVAQSLKHISILWWNTENTCWWVEKNSDTFPGPCLLQLKNWFHLRKEDQVIVLLQGVTVAFNLDACMLLNTIEKEWEKGTRRVLNNRFIDDYNYDS